GSIAVLFALNGRWIHQAAAGHFWHLQYAWLPWTLLFFDRALVDRSVRDAVISGAFLALTVFMCGIYPVPHAAIILVLYALVIAVLSRRKEPVILLLVTGVTGAGLSAPKLLPVLDLMERVPRKTTSTEIVD